MKSRGKNRLAYIVAGEERYLCGARLLAVEPPWKWHPRKRPAHRIVVYARKHDDGPVMYLCPATKTGRAITWEGVRVTTLDMAEALAAVGYRLHRAEKV